MNDNELSINIMTWNTKSVNMCESSIVDRRNGRSLMEILNGWIYSGYCPDFLKDMTNNIKKELPKLLVFALQEDAKPGSYLLSHAVPDILKPEYVLVERTRMMGVGVTTYKKFFQDFSLQLRGLRMAIFALNSWWKTISDKVIVESDYATCSGIYSFTKGKGAISISIDIPEYGCINFINLHLPFDSSSLSNAVTKNDPHIRQDALQKQNVDFNDIYRKMVIEKKNKSDYLFIMGDMNYRVTGIDADTLFLSYDINDKDSFTNMPRIFQMNDELVKQQNLGLIYSMNEGISGRGPTFMPTTKLSIVEYDEDDEYTRQKERYFKIGKDKQRIPSYCDRILYKTLNPKKANIISLEYERYDKGIAMAQSDHAAVIGKYIIIKNRENNNRERENGEKE